MLNHRSSNKPRKTDPDNQKEALMGVSRRDFMKLSGGTVLLASLGVNLDPAKAYAKELRIKNAKQTTTVCPYCSVGCGILVYAENGKVIQVEGDPDHPINEGTLCSKGSSLVQMANNDTRVGKPMYREPGGTAWKEVEWEWALDRIARLVKDARDKSFMTVKKAKVKEKQPDGTEIEVEKEFVVNRTDAIAHIGSAAMDNEECYLMQKLVRSWGLVYIEHQARI
jgi:formate dehydrogenase major subunit